MTRKVKHGTPAIAATQGCGCCRIESITAIDKRGHIVLPKKVPEKAGFAAGSDLAIITWGGGGKIYCVLLVKAEQFAEMVNELLGPRLGKSSQKGGQEHAE